MGGAHAVYLNTAELLRKNGHEVFYYAFKDEKMQTNYFREYFPLNRDYRNLTLTSKLKSVKSFLYNREAYQKIKEYIKIVKPEIAHLHLFMGGLTVSILEALKENSIPIVHTVHDYRLICPAYTFLDRNNNICELCKDGFFLRCAYKRCSLEGRTSHSIMLAIDAYYRKYNVDPLKLIDHYIFVSSFSQNKHTEFNSLFQKKSTILYNFKTGVFSNSYIRGNYILYYGRLSREKGIELLVKVAKKINCKLKIVGTGPLFQDLFKESCDNVEVLGFKSGEELWNLIKESMYIVVPSEWYENNPLTIVESFSFGKPIIGSNIGGITELLKDGRGFLFEPKSFDSLSNAIVQALSLNETEYKLMSQKVFEFANVNFSEEVHYKSLMNIYNLSINDKGSFK